jgi:trans-L-3-hydroxyproline dehydratase
MPAALTVTDMHTAGEPVRIVTGGYPELTGASILDKRREALDHHDHLRRAMMAEPRGHAEMYGVIPVEPSDAARLQGAVFACLFTHNGGYSTMCGHATIALGRWLIETGQVGASEPETRFAIEVPCGVVHLRSRVQDGRVVETSFDSVPAFLARKNLTIDVAGLGEVVCDIAYGGAFYAVLESSRLGLDFFATLIERLRAAAMAITDTVRARETIIHPTEPDLGFLYGTILTCDAAAPEPTSNLCVFAEGQIDRSPTGSGVTARLARDHARGLIGAGVKRVFKGPSGVGFTGEILSEVAILGLEQPGVIARVAGAAHFTGDARFVIEPEDALGAGFLLPKTFGG